MNYFGLISSVFSQFLTWINTIFEASLGVNFVAVVSIGCVWIALLGFIFKLRLPSVRSEQVEDPEREENYRMQQQRMHRG